jgi:hypothetical protein
MGILQSISKESLISGKSISDGKSIHWTYASAWHWSKSAGSLRLLHGTHSLIWLATPLSQEKWQSGQIGQITVSIRRSPKNTWCDYCKLRWGVNHVRGQVQAVWWIRSETRGKVIDRHYCFACSTELQTWTDGQIWSFQQQLDYAKGKQELDVQFE